MMAELQWELDSSSSSADVNSVSMLTSKLFTGFLHMRSTATPADSNHTQITFNSSTSESVF